MAFLSYAFKTSDVIIYINTLALKGLTIASFRGAKLKEERQMAEQLYNSKQKECRIKTNFTSFQYWQHRLFQTTTFNNNKVHKIRANGDI